MSATWNTKYGTRRVRHDPPTLAEAIAAAQGLTDDQQGQIQIAADLMGVSLAEAKAELQKLAPDRRAVRLVSTASREGAPHGRRRAQGEPPDDDEGCDASGGLARPSLRQALSSAHISRQPILVRAA